MKFQLFLRGLSASGNRLSSILADTRIMIMQKQPAKFIRFVKVVCLVSLFVSVRLHAECQAWSSESESKPLTIGKIEIHSGDIFVMDKPGQSSGLHRAANRFHIRTSHNTLEALVNLEENDPFSSSVLADIERRLRSMNFIREATVEPTQICGGKVDIRISTVDNWTLTPSVSFGSAGGESKMSFDIDEGNLFGSGTELKIGLRKKNGIDSYRFGYAAPVFFSNEQGVSFEFTKSDISKSTSIKYQRGHHNYDNGWTLTAAFDNSKESISREADAHELHDTKVALEALRRISKKVSVGVNVTDTASLLESGAGLDKRTDYDRANLSVSGIVEFKNLSYQEITNYKSVDQIEDLGLGTSLRLATGLARSRDGNENGLVLGLDYNYGSLIGTGVLTVGLGLSQLSDGEHTIREISSHAEWVASLGSSSRFRIRADSDLVAGLSFVDNFEIGGENALKGYPNGHQSGPRRARLTTEFRHDLPFRMLNLGRLGFTVFAETGRSWGDSQSDNRPWLANVGSGVVFSPSRSSSNNLVRMDLAVPLTDNEEIAALQLYIGAESSF